jgi:hypothetical protein
MEHNFKNILDYLDKEDIEDILEYYEFPKSGKKEKLIEIILKNATLFESAIGKLLDESYKEDIQEMCGDLGIDSNSNVSELKSKILDKVTKNIHNRDIQNKIKFLDFAFGKDELHSILDVHSMPRTGKKEKLLQTIARNDSVVYEAISEWKKESYKEDIQEMCGDLGIDSDGNKEKLLQRIIDYIFKIKIKKDIQNNPTKKTIQSIKNNDEITEKKSSSPKRRGWTDMQKEDVRERQDGRCNECNKHPPRWEYHHIDCDSNNNRLDNCEALCPNCHSIKTHENDR